MRFVLVVLVVTGSILLVLSTLVTTESDRPIRGGPAPGKAAAPAVPPVKQIRFTTLARRYVYSKHDLMNVVRGPDGGLWAAGYDGHNPNRVYKSRDGSNWQIVPVETGGGGLADLAFSDGHNLWGVGYQGTLCRSSDAGATWLSQPKPTRANLDAIAFASPRVGYIAGAEARPDLTEYQGGYGPSYAVLFRTQDGGETWQMSYRNEDDPGSVFSIATFSETGAIVSVGARRLIRTENGGRSWKRVGTAEMDPNTVRCIPGGDCWAVGPNGFFRSADTGRTWSRVTASTSVLSGRYWWSIDFATEKVGIAVGENGACVFTSDGGATWVNVPNPPESVFGPEALRSITLYGSWGLILGSQSLHRIELPFLDDAPPMERPAPGPDGSAETSDGSARDKNRT